MCDIFDRKKFLEYYKLSNPGKYKKICHIDYKKGHFFFMPGLYVDFFDLRRPTSNTYYFLFRSAVFAGLVDR